jgi:predicted RND superfamily exporter protein
VRVSDKSRKALLKATTTACGILALVLFRWTPTTGIGILVYVAMFVVMIAVAIVLSPRKPAGYWPNKSDEND